MNTLNAMIHSQRCERCADSSSLLGFLQQAILHDFTRQNHASFEGCVVKTRSNHFQTFFFFAALAVDRSIERIHRCAFFPASSFPSSLHCLLQQTMKQWNNNNNKQRKIIFARWKHTTSMCVSNRPNCYHGNSYDRSACSPAIGSTRGPLARAVFPFRTTSIRFQTNSTRWARWLGCYIEVGRREEGIVIRMMWTIRRSAAAKTATEERAEYVQWEEEDFEDSVEPDDPNNKQNKDDL